MYVTVLSPCAKSPIANSLQTPSAWMMDTKRLLSVPIITPVIFNWSLSCVKINLLILGGKSNFPLLYETSLGKRCKNCPHTVGASCLVGSFEPFATPNLAEHTSLYVLQMKLQWSIGKNLDLQSSVTKVSAFAVSLQTQLVNNSTWCGIIDASGKEYRKRHEVVQARCRHFCIALSQTWQQSIHEN